MRVLPVCFPTVPTHSREGLHFVGVSRRKGMTPDKTKILLMWLKIRRELANQKMFSMYVVKNYIVK